MAVIVKKQNQWKLSGDIHMDDANALLEASKQLSFANNMTIDFKEINEVDTATVSLMLVWKRRAKAENKTLRFLNMPKGLTSLLDLYGVASLFN